MVSKDSASNGKQHDAHFKQPRNLLPSRAYAADLLLGEGFRGFLLPK